MVDRTVFVMRVLGAAQGVAFLILVGLLYGLNWAVYTAGIFWLIAHGADLYLTRKSWLQLVSRRWLIYKWGSGLAIAAEAAYLSIDGGMIWLTILATGWAFLMLCYHLIGDNEEDGGQ